MNKDALIRLAIKRIMVAVPEKAEYEVGFLASAQRIKTLSQVLGAKMEFFASKNTDRKSVV